MKLFQLLSVLVLSLFALSCSQEQDPGPAPVQYSFLKTNTECSNADVQGSVILGTALTMSNRIIITVDVTAIGDYSVTTNTVNGISYSVSGSFTVTGPQYISLIGSGTPVAAGTHVFTITGGGNTCEISVTTVTSVAPGILRCKMNGVFYDFSLNPQGSLVYNAGINLKVYGRVVPSGNTGFEVWIQHNSINPLTPGTYNVHMPGFYVKGQYTDAIFNYWMGVSNGSTWTNPFTVVINSVTSTRVVGTFSGLLKENAGTGPNTKTVTEGYFDMPL